MKPRITPAALAVGALLALTGCGSGGQAGLATDPSTPSASTVVTGTPEQQAEPQWPADCGTRSSTAFDFARQPDGWRTPQDAVLNSQMGDIPTGTLQVAAPKPHTEQQVYVLDDSGTILASVSVIQGSTGWFVDGLTTCA